MEIKVSRVRMERVKTQLRFEECFKVYVVVRNEGLALLWKEDLMVTVGNYLIRHITVQVFDTKRNNSWRLIGFYGEPDASKRHLA